jgi:hypothetical protein
MSTFGRRQVATVGRSIRLSADGKPVMKHAGVTIDWSTVAAVAGADVVLSDGVTVYIGEKYLRYGQVITKITASGKYGPYDPGAADGRQTLTIGNVFVVNQTMKETDLHSDHPEALYGGLVWKDRLLQSGVGAASLAAGPTLANFIAALPQIEYVNESPQ